MLILAGDVGGTKTLLQLIEVTRDSRTPRAEKRYESSAWPTFEGLVEDFVEETGRPGLSAACFAVAGPVFGRRAEITNLTWTIDADALGERFEITWVALINDFFAVATGVPLLPPSDLLSLNAGRRVAYAPIAILGAGTGLGEANVIHDGEKWNVVPSEGGHADFAPQDEEQARLFLDLLRSHDHVSWERVLSGMGLVNIHNFLTGQSRPYDEQVPVEIASAAAAGDGDANRALGIFADIYGAEAGNMALRVLARGGVFLAGGIAAKNIGHFTNGRFLEAFLRKGRFRSLMQEIPVDVVLNQNVGLLGAAEMAVRLV